MDNIFLNKIAGLIINKIKQKLDENNSISSGDLKNNITPIISDNSIGIEMLDYAIYVDKGTGPRNKMPPIDPIKRWVENKNININPWAIATNIKKYGTKAHPFLDVLDNLDFLEPYINEYMEEQIKKIQLKI